MRVITYAHPRELAGHKEWKLLATTPHLCATQSLADGMREFYQDRNVPARYLTAPIVAINNLFDKMMPAWSADLTLVEQYSEVTKAIDWLAAQKPAWATRLDAFRRVQQEVLRTVRTLAEGGLTPATLPANTEDEQIFRALWVQMEADDPALKALRTDMQRELTVSARFRDRFETALAAAAKEDKTVTPDLPVQRVVLHGFYFITPLQGMMIGLLEQAGIELIYLNCYDERHDRMFSAWKPFFPSVSTWEVQKSAFPVPPAAQCFADLFAQKAAGSLAGVGNPRVLRYPDASALLEDIRLQKAAGELPVLYSPLATDLNDLLRDFYPEEYSRRHFLAYPAGRFLYELHRMWDEREDALHLTPDGLMECLTSGLLQMDGLHGQDYVLALRRAWPLLEAPLPATVGTGQAPRSCRTRAEWQEQLQWLSNLVSVEVPAWETPIPPGHPDYPVHALLHNPFRRLGYGQVSPEDAEALRRLTDYLFVIAEELFKNDDVPIRDHLERIHAMVQQGVAPSRLLAKEKDLLEELQRHLDTVQNRDTALPRKDLAAALQFFLGGVTKEKDHELVKGVDRLDGVPLHYPEGPLHLCLLAEGALPSRPYRLPWPLTEQSLLQIQNSEPCADLLLKRRQEAANASLYLFYYALAYGTDVTLSWAAEWKRDQVEESIYLLLLEDAGLEPVDRLAQPWAGKAEPEPLPELPWAPQGLPKAALTRHAVAEYTLCPKRWFYSYGTSPGPVYESAFHHGFLYPATIIRRMQNHTSWRAQNQPTAMATVSKFFPHLTPARQRDLARRYAQGYGRTADVVETEEYNNNYRRLLVVGTGPTRLEKAQKVFTTDAEYQKSLNEVQGLAGGVMPPFKKGDHCRFCPYTGHCRYAELPIDDDLNKS